MNVYKISIHVIPMQHVSTQRVPTHVVVTPVGKVTAPAAPISTSVSFVQLVAILGQCAQIYLAAMCVDAQMDSLEMA